MVSRPRHARTFFDRIPSWDSDLCLLWPYANIKGYAAIRIDGKTEYVCRLICPGSPTPEKPNVLHSCGRGAEGCVNIRHLRYGSQQDNCDDREVHGTVNRGTRNGRHILTPEEVKEVRRLLASGMLQREVADVFGVSRGCVKDISTGANWSWLK